MYLIVCCIKVLSNPLCFDRYKKFDQFKGLGLIIVLYIYIYIYIDCSSSLRRVGICVNDAIHVGYLQLGLVYLPVDLFDMPSSFLLIWDLQ